jgi:DNA-nicking Smr family endonuclease
MARGGSTSSSSMTRRKPRPSDDERALWLDAMRDVARLQPGEPMPAPPPAATPPPRAKSATAGAAPGAVAPGLDRRSAERLKRGQLRPEARLDLHGMTQEEAHRALEGFLTSAQESGKRAVLVITGKGSGGGRGVLRDAVPRWLGEAPNRGRVLATATAQPKDGGSGALYVLLRRRR